MTARGRLTALALAAAALTACAPAEEPRPPIAPSVLSGLHAAMGEVQRLAAADDGDLSAFLADDACVPVDVMYYCPMWGWTDDPAGTWPETDDPAALRVPTGDLAPALAVEQFAAMPVAEQRDALLTDLLAAVEATPKVLEDQALLHDRPLPAHVLEEFPELRG